MMTVSHFFKRINVNSSKNEKIIFSHEFIFCFRSIYNSFHLQSSDANVYHQYNHIIRRPVALASIQVRLYKRFYFTKYNVCFHGER